MIYDCCIAEGGSIKAARVLTLRECGCLPHNGYDNPVSKLTGMVLRAFVAGEKA